MSQFPVRYAEATRLLKQRLITGELAPGERLPNRLELETELGLSRSTIQTAFDQLIADGFVEARGRAGTFVVDRPPYLYNVGVVMMFGRKDWKSWGSFFQSIANQATGWSGKRDMAMTLYSDINPPSGHNESYLKLLDDAREHRVAGLILIHPARDLVESELFEVPMIPKVAVGGADSPGVPMLTIERPRFLKLAMERIVGEGRRRVGGLILSGTHTQRSFERQILDPIRARGLETHPYWWQFVNHSDLLAARNAAEMMMRVRSTTKIDAFIIEDDNLVDGATAGIAAAGIQVPQEVLVVAMGVFPDTTHSHVPALRIGPNVENILDTAVDLLIRRRKGVEVPQSTAVVTASEEYWQADQSSARV